MVRSLLDVCFKTLLVKEGRFLSSNAESVAQLPRCLKDRLCCQLATERNGLADLHLLEALVHPHLTHIDLSKVDWIDDRTLGILAKSTHLQSINLNAGYLSEFRIGVSPMGLTEVLQNKRFLTSLHLRGNGLALSDEVFELLQSDCPSLNTIDMSHCSPGLSEQGLYAIRDLPLCSLSLSQTNISDEGLKILSQGECVKHLQELKIDGCYEVFDSGVEAILASCPRLKVFLFDYSPKLSLVARRALDEYFRRYQVQQLSWTIPI